MNFEDLLHSYIPLSQKGAFLDAHPNYLELLGKEIAQDAVKDFAQVALSYLGLLGTGIETPHHSDAATVATPAAVSADGVVDVAAQVVTTA